MNTDRHTSASRQIELIIRRLNSLSTLPEVAAGFLPELANGQMNAAALAEIIESDPALTVKIFSLAHQQGIEFSDKKPSVVEAVAKLPNTLIRDAILSVKVFQAFDFSYNPNAKRALPRKELALYIITTACCARALAELVLPEEDRGLAYSAGLLHDIGKLALEEVMPKSFHQMVEEAREKNSCLLEIEQQHLGLDHAVIGKRLAQRWNLPEEIMMAIWLQNTDIAAVSENLPTAKIAQVVRLASLIARQTGIGHSGNYDSPNSMKELLDLLSLSEDQIGRIREQLPDRVSEKTSMLGLQTDADPASYCDLVHKTAAKLANTNATLTVKNTELNQRTSHNDFLTNFFERIHSNGTTLDAASDLAVCWKMNFKTGPVCILLFNNPNDPYIEAAFTDDTSHVTTTIVKRPADISLPEETSKDTAVLTEAGGYFSWLFEQVELPINTAATKYLPVTVGNRLIAGILFEQQVPYDKAYLQSLKKITDTIAKILDMIHVSQNHAQLSERFVDLLGRLRKTRDQLTESRSLIGIAEMAAGAAHELNNPLAVISGRSQLLYDVETDEEKKKKLTQIMQRTDEITNIVSDLMAYAKPNESAPRTISVPVLIDGALTQLRVKYDLSNVTINITDLDNLPDVYVDSQQIVSALINILSNAVESLENMTGQITISGSKYNSASFSAISIIDNGCGMDSTTLQKAFQPFFSAKKAGRKRGMGLAHAQRLLQLNGASLELSSIAKEGTTVHIRLPRTR